ncbi:hypothetical protein [Bacillus sp. KH172YL63]|uniref:hypothetical protein n=1 Tax=Bacillus sp. KH172YL63 TaxID=2709784 RepID=UPI0013E45F71|nr:hypothetical protein [Bacillus sp. KH172YL63]BCB04056.1 hypothetical protein KH172YL63_21890 [Bacillus sp. KH172YL63]
MLKRLYLKRNFMNYKKGEAFVMVAESEYIGIKEYILRTHDYSERIIVSEGEMAKYFVVVN